VVVKKFLVDLKGKGGGSGSEYQMLTPLFSMHSIHSTNPVTSTDLGHRGGDREETEVEEE
jgi:hypothetical protein